MKGFTVEEWEARQAEVAEDRLVVPGRKITMRIAFEIPPSENDKRWVSALLDFI